MVMETVSARDGDCYVDFGDVDGDDSDGDGTYRHAGDGDSGDYSEDSA